MPVTVKVGGKLSSVLTAIHKTFIKFWFFKNKLPKWEFVTEKQITNDTHTPREFFPLGIVGHYLFFSVPHCQDLHGGDRQKKRTSHCPPI